MYHQLLLIAVFLSIALGSIAQTVSTIQQVEQDSLFRPKPTADTEIDFLFHYYDQEGNHSAVTGGVGTEKLNDYDSKIRVSVPLDSISQLQVEGGVHVYTSASTDRIDAVISSASSNDIHSHLSFGWEETPTEKNIRYGFSVAGAVESDYISGSISGFLAIASADNNRELQLQSELFFDRWQLIFPDELRGSSEATVATDRRNTYNFSLIYRQVMNQRIQWSLSSDLSWQHGLLSTPFHRVYFPGEALPRIERLPGQRIRLPVALRLNASLGDFIVAKSYYRYYWDSFQIKAHSLQLGLAFKLGSSWTLSPSWRYHTQQAATHFQAFASHAADAEFYTSDFDLSAFNSQQWSVNLRYSPLYGLTRWRLKKNRGLGILESAELRFSTYRRTDGLRAFTVGSAFHFSLSGVKRQGF